LSGDIFFGIFVADRQCTYTGLQDFITEQSRVANKVPGPVFNNDLIVDEIQIVRSAAVKCQGVVLVLDIEAIVAVSAHE
jgi:indole-3-glycerol phosphate synthase